LIVSGSASDARTLPATINDTFSTAAGDDGCGFESVTLISDATASTHHMSLSFYLRLKTQQQHIDPRDAKQTSDATFAKIEILVVR